MKTPGNFVVLLQSVAQICNAPLSSSFFGRQQIVFLVRRKWLLLLLFFSSQKYTALPRQQNLFNFSAMLNGTLCSVITYKKGAPNCNKSAIRKQMHNLIPAAASTQLIWFTSELMGFEVDLREKKQCVGNIFWVLRNHFYV